MKNILINGSFLYKKITGVSRFGFEVAKRILETDDHAKITFFEKEHPLINKDQILFIPKSNFSKLFGTKVWNQIDVPKRVNSSLFFSTDNLAPLGIENHFITIHDLAAIEHPEWFTFANAKMVNFYIRKLSLHAKKIFTVSNFSKERIIRILGIRPDDVVVTYLGVDKRFRPIDRNEVEIIKDKYKLPSEYFLSLGTIEPRKNLKNLLLAWNKIGSVTKGDTKFVIAGSCYKEYSKMDLRHLDSGDLIYTGYFPDEDLPALYSGAKAFIYPSLYEGFGLPALEAMSCGTPVITSENTSMQEILSKDAVYVNPYDVASICEGLEFALVNGAQLSQFSKRGLERSGRFRWEETARIVYENVSS